MTCKNLNKIFQAKIPTQKQDGRIYFTVHDAADFDMRHISSLSPLPKIRQPFNSFTCLPNLTGHQDTFFCSYQTGQ